MKYELKRYEDLFFTDDFLFSKIMRNQEIARGVVESLLGFKVKKIKFLTSQYSVNEVYGGKGVRLDAYLEDSGRVIDIEMQTVVRADEGLRMRYYQSIIDIEHLSRGENYRKLKESYVIFICLDDPFGDGKPIYNFVTREADGERILNDRIHKVIYNASSFEKARNSAVRAFLKFVKERAASDSVTQKIQTEVETCRTHQKWRSEYMLWQDQVREWKDEAHEAGFAEGKAKGIAEGETYKANETAKNLLNMKLLTPEQISQATNLSVKKVLAIKKNIEQSP